MESQFKNVLVDLIKKPRFGFQRIIDDKIDKYKFWLIASLGISAMFGNSMSKGLGDKFGFVGLLLYIILCGPIFAIIWAYLLSGLISWTGRWLKGQAKINDILNIISYAAIPLILTLIVHLIYFSLFGSSIFTSSFDIKDFGVISFIVYKIGFFINLFLLIYYCILFVIGISVLQRFSILKSILNIFLGIFVIIFPLVIIGFIIAILR